MKVYAVYSIPKSPEYRLEKLFKSKEAAKKYIEKNKKNREHALYENGDSIIYDIQLEDIEE